jgi:PT repeat
MSTERPRRMSARTAEDLLDRAGGDAQHPLLAATLRAAAGPARPGELAGRHQALAAFNRARQDPVVCQRRPSMIKTTLLKLLTVKAATIAAVVVGTGGVALAASTGAIPNPLNNHPAPAASASKSHPGAPDASARPGNADPSPSLVGLCHAYTAGAGSDHGKALESPAFQALLTAAGGKDKVDAFCTGILASAKPTDHPTGQPSEQPTEHPTEHPTGQPTEHPTGQPTGHPTGQPTTHPSH